MFALQKRRRASVHQQQHHHQHQIVQQQLQQLQQPHQNRKSRRRIWQEDEVHKLIIVWRMRLDDLRQSKKNRHIYEEISDELNRQGLDTIREEVHIKIQNLSQLYRNEKRRIEATGDAPIWPYYNEIDELLGSHNDSGTNDSSVFDDTAELAKSEVVSVDDSGSDAESDNPALSFLNNHHKNGFDCEVTISEVENPKKIIEHRHTLPASLSPSTSVASSSQSLKQQLAALNKSISVTTTTTPPSSISITNDTSSCTNNLSRAAKENTHDLHATSIQLEILKQIKKANTLAELEYEETKFLHQEMKELEQQRFNLTQMFIERSLTLQKQILDCLRANGRSNGGTSAALNTSTSTPLRNSSTTAVSSISILPRANSNRPQFILAKKKK